MRIHYTHNYIINPRHRVTVNLIGAGGTGSQVIGALARIDHALYKLGHPGLYVTVYDDDIVSESNIGRQLFRSVDVGQNKANVLATRINTFYGVDWEAMECRYSNDSTPANITITCVDNVASRMTTGKVLRSVRGGVDDNEALYWLDFGNQLDRGQVVLGTIKAIQQPKKTKGKTAVRSLQCVDEMFDLSQVNDADSGPSCSLSEALRKQDLFINSFLAQTGCALLWKLIYDGAIDYHGAFVNLATMNVNPIKV